MSQANNTVVNNLKDITAGTSSFLILSLLLTDVAIKEELISIGLKEMDKKPRHKGGKRHKKTWAEKQQIRRGWGPI